MLSRHASARSQQRNIPPILIEWLLDHGHRERTHGADVVYFDRRARRALQKEVGSWLYEKVGSKLGVYAVVANDGTIITTGYRRRKFKSN